MNRLIPGSCFGLLAASIALCGVVATSGCNDTALPDDVPVGDGGGGDGNLGDGGYVDMPPFYWNDGFPPFNPDFPPFPRWDAQPWPPIDVDGFLPPPIVDMAVPPPVIDLAVPPRVDMFVPPPDLVHFPDLAGTDGPPIIVDAGAPDMAAGCRPGLFSGAASGSIGGFAVAGTLSFTLGAAQGNLYPITSGKLFMTGLFQSTVTSTSLSGALDCQKNSIAIDFAKGDIFALNQHYPFTGSATGTFVPIAQLFINGTWNLASQNGQFKGNGIWSGQ